MTTQRNKMVQSFVMFFYTIDNNIQDLVCIVHHKYILNNIVSNCKTVHLVSSLHMTSYIISLM